MLAARESTKRRPRSGGAGPEAARPKDASPLAPWAGLQRSIGNREIGELLEQADVRHAHEERAADRFADSWVPRTSAAPSHRGTVRVQRKCAACSVGASCASCGSDEDDRPSALQPMLDVSKPGDSDEEEADRIAARAFGESGDREIAGAHTGPTPIQRKPSANAKELVHADGVHLAALRGGGGAPLPHRTREVMEERLGYDFSAVRVHDGPSAAQAASGLSARAFTAGRDVVFGRGQYSPDTQSGQALLAHELVHVVQQGEARSKSRSAAGAVTHARGGAVQRQPAQNPRPNVIEMRRPPFFPQTALTCWASAIAAWRLAKGLRPPPVDDAALIAQYRGTACVDASGAIAGAGNIQDVFGEHRLLLDLGAQINNLDFTADRVRTIILNHGHFVLVWGFGGTLHAVVVYGFQALDATPHNFNLFVMDPMANAGMPRDPAVAGDRSLHHMFINFPVAVAVGLPRSAGPAPCGLRRGAAGP
jgi:hypothetical protein